MNVIDNHGITCELTTGLSNESEMEDDSSSELLVLGKLRVSSSAALPVADPGFPAGAGVTLQGAHNFANFFPKNCMKLKEFGRPRGYVSLTTPLRSADGYSQSSWPHGSLV